MDVKKQYKIYYWSFWIGHPTSLETEWIFKDHKIPASTIREAIIHESIMRTYHFREFSNDYSRFKNRPYDIPNQSYVWITYRRIVQFEKIYTPKRGYTVHQYKKIAVHSVHSFLKLFGS